jgi:hypothetical protein
VLGLRAQAVWFQNVAFNDYAMLFTKKNENLFVMCQVEKTYLDREPLNLFFYVENPIYLTKRNK